jgi:hypothetical protein
LERVCQQRAEAMHDEDAGVDWGDDREILYLLDWFVSTGCGLHDANNGLKWSASQAGSPEIHRDVFVIVESLRNSFSMLHSHLRPFLMSHIAFDQPSGNDSLVVEYWEALGIAAGFVGEVAAVNPFFDGGLLHVSSSLEGNPGAMERISAVILYMLRWKQATDSRFVTAGPTMKSVLAGLSVGLNKIVAMTRSDPHCSDYYLHGFGRISDAHIRYMITVGLSSFLSDAIVLAIMG